MDSKEKTLYISDLDGTLLNDNSELSDRTVELLNTLIDAGACISFATARTPATVTDIFKNVRLKIPGIVMTGASLYDLSTKRYIFPHFLREEKVKAALDLLEKKKVRPFIYTWREDNKLHAFHAMEMSDQERSFCELRRNRNLKQFHIGYKPEEEDYKHTLLIFCLDRREKLENLVTDIKECIGYSPSYYNDIFNEGTGFLEIFAEGINKANAARNLKKETGASRLVVFGDNLNDIPLMKVADVSVAPINAFPEVKEIASTVIGNNNDDSVAQFIYKDFYGKQ